MYMRVAYRERSSLWTSFLIICCEDAKEMAVRGSRMKGFSVVQ